MPKKEKRPSFVGKIIKKGYDAFEYCTQGVWKDTRDTFWIRVVKTLNLSVRSFLDSDLQIRSMALTYITVLAIVPAFALLFAIGRGFGLQKMISDSIYSAFPAQHQAVQTTISFVDRYLKESSQGVFVGIGIVMLLWTIISMLSNIENTFNKIWDVRHDRSFYRKITDYTAICFFIPILMICSSGVSIFVSTTVADSFSFLTPVVNVILDISPFLLACLAFTLAFFLIPNCKVKFSYSAVAGFMCGISFQILQLLFVNGQIYVSKYNAIYGSFAFLPLLLVWLQLSWLILLSGCVITYSAQNVFGFNYTGDITNISQNYLKKVAIIVMAAIMHRFEEGKAPMTATELAKNYGLPIRLVNLIVNKLAGCELIYFVMLSDDKVGVAPAVDNDKFTVTSLLSKLDSQGLQDFIPQFDTRYADALKTINKIVKEEYCEGSDILIRSISLPKVEGDDEDTELPHSADAVAE